jgi:hypothetical protein
MEKEIEKLKETNTSLIRGSVLIIILSLFALFLGYVELHRQNINNAVEKRILTNRIYLYKIDSVKTSYTIKLLNKWNFVKNNGNDKEIHSYLCRVKKARLNGI